MKYLLIVTGIYVGTLSQGLPVGISVYTPEPMPFETCEEVGAVFERKFVSLGATDVKVTCKPAD